MTREVIYIAKDGASFKSIFDCEDYEKSLARKEKECFEQGAWDTLLALCKKYLPDTVLLESSDKPDYFPVDLWYQTDLVSIVLFSPAKPSLEDLKAEILESRYGRQILEKISLGKVEQEIAIRSDWAGALEKATRGSSLSASVQYGFNEHDLKELACLHRDGRFRKKIEMMLTDCNFHDEVDDFRNGRYAEYLAVSK